MSAPEAVRVAIDLVQVPSRVRRQQSRPLPDGVVMVLRIAAGDEAAQLEACQAASRPPALVARAAAFFVEQILFCPNADSYRVLGANRDATAHELRRNMALVLRWCHPDRDRVGNRSIFAARATQAWETLKTPERRAAYDKENLAQDFRSRKRKTMTRTQRRLRRYVPRHRVGIGRQERKGLLRRALYSLFPGARFRRI